MTVQFSTYGQAIQKHLWKERVVLIISANKDSDLLERQMIEFTDLNGFIERKLVCYYLLPNAFRYIDNNHQDYNLSWQSNSGKLYEEYADPDESFSIILVGLDGGIKMRRHTTVSQKDLFRLIDSMPMRQAELRKKSNFKKSG